jgi:hypothetical protein
MDVLKKYVPNMSRSLTGLQRIVDAGTTLSISALYGNKHGFSEHRQFRAIDINYVNGVRVRTMTARQACDAALKLQVSGATTIAGPASMGSICQGGVIKPDSGHNDHFHVAWGPGSGMAGFVAGDTTVEDTVDSLEEGPIE